MKTLNIFKSKFLKFIRPSVNIIFGFHNPIGVKLLTRLELELSHFCEHKFKQSFRDILNQLCSCGKEVETNFYFLLSRPNYSDKRFTLLSKIRYTNPNILENINYSIAQFFYTQTRISLLRLISLFSVEIYWRQKDQAKLSFINDLHFL